MQDGKQRGNPEQDQSRHHDSFPGRPMAKASIGGGAARAGPRDPVWLLPDEANKLLSTFE